MKRVQKAEFGRKGNERRNKKGLSISDNEWERRRGEDKKSGIKGR
jgi:hypothetical protein